MQIFVVAFCFRCRCKQCRILTESIPSHSSEYNSMVFRWSMYYMYNTHLSEEFICGTQFLVGDRVQVHCARCDQFSIYSLRQSIFFFLFQFMCRCISAICDSEVEMVKFFLLKLFFFRIQLDGPLIECVPNTPLLWPHSTHLPINAGLQVR